MTASTLPILPTTVVGSYAIPAWLWAAYEKIEAGGFGRMDVAETENDAVATAVRDQERAGVDVISDGEMRRQGFIVSIFKYFHGLKPIEPRRKVGVLSYDGHVLYEPVERISAPDGLGTVRELQYLRQVTARPFKITLPGPLTLATQITKGGPYRDRVEVATDLAPADTATLDPEKVLAIVTERGGPTGHTAILAKQLGIPAVTACPEAARKKIHIRSAPDATRASRISGTRVAATALWMKPPPSTRACLSAAS